MTASKHPPASARPFPKRVPRGRTGLSCTAQRVLALSGTTLLSSALLLSCNADSTEPHLLDSALSGNQTAADDLARSHKLQEVTWTVDVGDGSAPVEGSGSAGNLVGLLAAGCSAYYSAGDDNPCAPDSDEFKIGGCGFGACNDTYPDLCISHRLLEIADGITSVGFTHVDESGLIGTIQVPPQGAATRADLRKEAASHAKDALVSSLEQLQDSATSQSCAASKDQVNDIRFSLDASYAGFSAGQLITQQAIEALNLFREATLSAANELVNYADTQRSFPTFSKGVEASTSAAELSRSEAIHLLIGGDPGLAGSPGLCDHPLPTPTQQAAIDAIREQGECPANFDDPEKIDEIVQGMLFPPLGDQNLNRHLFTETDIRAGLDILKQQANAFAVSKTASFTNADGKVIFTGALQPPKNVDVMFYGAVARARTPGAFGPRRSDSQATVGMPSIDDLRAATSYVDVVDIAGELIDELVGRTWAPSLKQDVEAPLALELMATDAERPGRLKLCGYHSAYPSQALVWGFAPSDRLLMVIGEDGLKCATDGNVDGTPCSIRNQNTGVYNSQWVLYPLDQAQSASDSGFEVAAASNLTGPQASTLYEQRLYLVRPKSATLPEAPGNYEAIAAGQVPEGNACDVIPIMPEIVRKAANWLRPNRDWCTLPAEECDGTFFDDRIPLEDELSDDGDGVESSWRHYLALAKQAADEADLLANEYINQGIGQDSRSEELELRQHAQDVEAIRDLEELQTICGTDVDPYALLNKMGVECNLSEVLGDLCSDDTECGGGTCLRGRCLTSDEWSAFIGSGCALQGAVSGVSCASGPCPAGMTCVTGSTAICIDDEKLDLAFSNGDLSNVVGDSCNPGGCDTPYICRAGKCVLSPEQMSEFYVEEPSIARLEACLGTGDSVIPAVAVGDVPLCFWRDPLRPNEVCTVPDGYEGDPLAPCPTPALSTGSGESTDYTCDHLDVPDPQGMAPTIQPEITEANLDYFATTRAAYGGSPTAACDALRHWRLGPSEERLEKALALGFNLPSSGIGSIAALLSFQAKLDSHSAVMIGQGEAKNPWQTFNTGDYEPPYISNLGPCAVNACPDGRGLLCDTYSCSSALTRRDVNMRLLYAVTALLSQTRTGGNSLEHYGTPIELFIDSPRPANGIEGISLGKDLFAGADPNDSENFVYTYGLGGGTTAYQWTPAAAPELTGWLVDTRLREYDIAVNGYIQRSTVSPVYRHDIPDSSDGHQITGFSPPTFYDGLANSDPRQSQCAPAKDDTRKSGECWLIEYMRRRSRGEFTDETPEVWGWHFAVGSLGQMGLNARMLLDGLELACEAAAERQSPIAGRIELNDLPPVESPEDLAFVGTYLDSLVQRVNQAGSNMLLFGVPRSAVDALRETGPTGAYPAIGGEYSAAVQRLRGALVRLSDFAPQLAAQVRQMKHDTDAIRERLSIIAGEGKRADIIYAKEVANNLTNCAVGLANGLGGVLSNPLGAVAAAATCANGAYQSSLAGQLRDVDVEIEGSNTRIAFAEFRGQFDSRAETLRELSVGISEAAEEIDSMLATIENLRVSARRSLGRALQTSTYQAGATRLVNNAMRSRFSTTKKRYDSALGYAKKMAILARRSIETRLGMHLANMKDELPLVEAPAGWAPDVCTSGGVDYNRLRAEGEPIDYSDAFIGDYVRKLEAVVESYRLAYNFHEGQDTAVVSLRDDIVGVKETEDCRVSTRNLLFHSEDLQSRVSETEQGWEVQGCPLDVDGAPTACLFVSELGSGGPLDDQRLVSAPGYRVTFGATPTVEYPLPECQGCNPGPNTRLQQPIALTAGRYQLAWYARPANSLAGTPDGSTSVAVIGDDGLRKLLPPPSSIDATSGWKRYFTDLSLDASEVVSIAVVPVVDVGGTVASQQVDVAALSLTTPEYLEGEVAAPRAFEPTGGTRTKSAELCQDTDGDKFRAKDWDRQCVSLCNNGFTGDCPQTDAKEYCFYETSFALSQKQIELGNQLTQSGFARGNFNYRIEDVAVNFVGTDLRACEASDLPQTCFSAGFIPYSLLHEGPYTVRNHAGESFDAKLYTGNIEHARGLATERYLSNPLSDADASLLSQYTRSEFKGRPLDGQFTLRVWEDDQFSFEKIQDVQLVLKYRYWTRFD